MQLYSTTTGRQVHHEVDRFKNSLEEAMFAFLFRTPTQDQDDNFDMEAASQTLRGRLDTMLENDLRRKTRFAVIEHPQR